MIYLAVKLFILTTFVLLASFHLMTAVYGASNSSQEFVVCSSVNLQGLISQRRIVRLRRCNVVMGHVRILNARFETRAVSSTSRSLNSTQSVASQNKPHVDNSSVYNDGGEDDDELIFANLVEITDYLLIFQLQNMQNLERLFPKLTIIRGDRLFKNNALILFLTNSLLKVGLKNLASVQRGSILLSRLYHTCYVNTIDWARLIKEKNASLSSASAMYKPIINLVKNDCYTQMCRGACKSDKEEETNGNHCWSEKDCQIKCPSECETNCDVSDWTKCCANSLCMYCKSNATVCVACSKYRNMITGDCVSSCDHRSSQVTDSTLLLAYENHSCIRYEDCSRESNSLVQGYHVHNDTHCLRECPSGYKSELAQRQIELKSGAAVEPKTISVSVCVKCKDNVCKKECTRSYTLRTIDDLEAIRNCFRVARLHIELRSSIFQQRLVDALQYLEVIDDYLIVVRNRHLNSLSFLKSLHLIKGNSLYEKKFALFVHTNDMLRELWSSAKNLIILNGTVKFFENPQLCYEDILRFLYASKLSPLAYAPFASTATHWLNDDIEVSFNFNGYKRLTCSNQTMPLSFTFEPNIINVYWNLSVADLRRIKGFALSYIKAPEGVFFNQNDIDLTHSALEHRQYSPFVDDEWNYSYLQYDESTMNRALNASIVVEPFTRYAIYVKLDLTMQYRSDNKTLRLDSLSLASFTDQLISSIYYVYSMPSSNCRLIVLFYFIITFRIVQSKFFRYIISIYLKSQVVSNL
jgi:hypothetical protein